MQPQAAYDELIRRTREEALLASCEALLGWDELTYMPRGGVRHRGEQMALLAGLLHERATDPRLGELLAAVEHSPLVADPEAPEAVNVRELRRSYDRLTRLPRSLVEEIARATSLGQQAWETAHRESDFALFLPSLARIVTLKRQEAEALGYGDVAYDALLDDYEPGIRSHDLARLFDALRRELVPLAAAITAAPRKAPAELLRRNYSIERQRVLGEAVMVALGFDFQSGRLDTAAHPFFSTVGPGDYRVTTRYDPHHFSESFFAVLHELGHALYEQNLPAEHHGTPMGEAASLGVHESQARLWENAVGRSRSFWDHFFPLVRQMFPGVLAEVDADAWYFALNHVGPSLIRVGADEVTYNLHILIRFELEQALICGDLQACDVPAAWNEAYGRLLGITPENDREGCLQDGHWGGGLIGYFPTYTLGNLYAAQLIARASAELGGLDDSFARGDFRPLLDWLRAKVYRHGSRYAAARLIEQATGAPPDPRPLVESLRQKYGPLYGI